MIEQAQQSPVEQAAQAVVDLEAKIAATGERIAANAESRAQLAYAAHADDDRKARKSLAELSDESTKLEHQAEDLTHALAEAKRRHTQATDDERHAGDRVLAERRLELAAGLRQAGQSMDLGFTAAKAEALWAVIDAVHATRFSHDRIDPGPTHQQLNVLGLQALETMLMATPWRKAFRHLAPHERRTWSALCDGWADMIERSARVELGEAVPTAEAAE